jgi:hypothetical protein
MMTWLGWMRTSGPGAHHPLAAWAMASASPHTMTQRGRHGENVIDHPDRPWVGLEITELSGPGQADPMPVGSTLPGGLQRAVNELLPGLSPR